MSAVEILFAVVSVVSTLWLVKRVEACEEKIRQLEVKAALKVIQGGKK